MGNSLSNKSSKKTRPVFPMYDVNYEKIVKPSGMETGKQQFHTSLVYVRLGMLLFNNIAIPRRTSIKLSGRCGASYRLIISRA